MKIALTNVWSRKNVGDALITLSTIQVIKDIWPNCELSIVAFDPQSFKKFVNKDRELSEITFIYAPTTTGVLYHLSKIMKGPLWFITFLIAILLSNILNIMDKNLSRFFSELCDSDLVISVGGNQLYGTRPLYSGQIYSHLIQLYYAKFIAKKKVALIAQSIGPIRDPLAFIMTKILLDRVDCITCRDKLTYNYLYQSIRLSNPNIFLTADIAFLYSSLNKTKIHLSNSIGITVRRWSSIGTNYYNYLDSIKAVICWLNSHDYNVFLIPFSTMSGDENDIDVCNEILSSIDPKTRLNTHILNISNYAMPKIITEMQNFKLLIATRFHSALIAILNGLPFILISYQHFKTQGIIDSFSQPPPWIPIEKVNEKMLINMVKNALEKRTILHSEVLQARYNLNNKASNNIEIIRKIII